MGCLGDGNRDLIMGEEVGEGEAADKADSYLEPTLISV